MKQSPKFNPISIESILFILFYMTTQGQLHIGFPLTVTISLLPGYNYGDHYLARVANVLTYNMHSIMWHLPT